MKVAGRMTESILMGECSIKLLEISIMETILTAREMAEEECFMQM